MTPHIVSIVGNDMTIDSRVKRVAAAAAAAGYRSTVVAFAPGGIRTESRMGDVVVVRVPVPFSVKRAQGRIPLVLRPIVGAELALRHAGPRTVHLALRRRLETDATGEKPIAKARLALLKVRMRSRRDGFRIRRRLHLAWDSVKRRVNTRRAKLRQRLFRRFRHPVPEVMDYEAAFGPEIEALRPDLIHAHDVHMIGVAITAAERLRTRGHAVKVIYDAHELIEGLSYPPHIIDGWLREEGSFIGRADAVLAVSPEQGEAITARYALPDPPTVIVNAPVIDPTAARGRTVRDDTRTSGRLLVYHGKVDRQRGVHILVEALAHLSSDVHAVVMAQTESPVTQQLREIAASLGVQDRLHILGFAPAERLPHYLSTADIAVSPFERTGNTDVSLPNKLFEAIQAGLPILASDTRALSRFINQHGVGEVFRSGSAEDLADKARRILDDPTRYHQHIEAMKPTTTWDHQAQRLIAVYAGILGVGEPPSVHVRARDIIEESGGGSMTKTTRLAVGPRNMAGQAFYLSQAVQHHLGVPSLSVAVDKPEYNFPVHIQVTPGDWESPTWQSAHRRMLASGFTHVVAESGTGVLGSVNGGFIDQQMELLRQDDIAVAILLHGSEIRDPRRHRQLPHSPYAVDDDFTRSLEAATARLRRHLKHLDVPVFVTTPDLLADVEAAWLPVVIDQHRWANIPEPSRDAQPVVLHLPSRGRLKGSDHVDRLLHQLASEGLVRYLRPERAAASEVPSLVKQAHIVIDGIVLGAYGVMSVQAMAAGRIAVANIRDIGALQVECPIVDANPDTLSGVLRDLISDRDHWKARIETAREYVSRYHSGRASAEALRSFLYLTDREE